MQALFVYATANLVAVGLPFAECLASRTSVLSSGSTLIHRKQAVPLNEWIAASPTSLLYVGLDRIPLKET